MATELAATSGIEGKGVQLIDTPELAAATMLYLCLGKANWLSGRYLSVIWDLEQVEKEWKEWNVSLGEATVGNGEEAVGSWGGGTHIA